MIKMENGQENASVLDHLDHCCQRVADTFGKPDASLWTNSDFVRLSSILYKKTQVQISPNTLKRIFGKIKTDARYYPQRATRDALARFVGFADWDTFIATTAGAEPPRTVLAAEAPQPAWVPTPEAAPAPPGKRVRSRKGLFVAFALVFGAVALWRGLRLWQNEKVPVTMICKNPEGDNPHSAVFVLRNFDHVSELTEDYAIDFGDSHKTPMNARDSIYSHYYEVPGRYFAVLRKGKEALDTVPVFLRTSGWTATANMMYDTTRVYPIEAPGLFEKGYYSINAREIARAGVDTNRTFFVSFINTLRSGIDGDNFELSVNVIASPPRPGVRCSQVRLTIFGDSSNHMVDIMKPGCVHWSKLQFSEVHKEGRSEGPNFLGADLTAGGTIGIKVVNRHATLSVNGREIYQTSYNKALRHIYGLSITFAGIGTVRSVAMKDLHTSRRFTGNF